MPSIRKRIGYLPSIKVHETINKIATKEKLSQSKVVGILVEEALLARDELDIKNTSNINNKIFNRQKSSLDKSSLRHHDFEEMISDKGITYNSKNFTNSPDKNSFKTTENYN